MPLSSPRSLSNAYEAAPIEWGGDLGQWLRLVAETTNGLLDGKINATSTFTLTANQATTVVDDSRCGPDSVILWMPTTANAGGELGIYITNRGVETSGVRGFTVNHATDSRTDRTFAYAIFG
jgi:hypothetical protein